MQKTISIPDLSQRETEDMELLSFGQSSHQIASHLFPSMYTVNDPQRRKLSARNVAQMIRKGFELQFLNTKNQLQ